jgi:hypothetical protein
LPIIRPERLQAVVHALDHLAYAHDPLRLHGPVQPWHVHVIALVRRSMKRLDIPRIQNRLGRVGRRSADEL